MASENLKDVVRTASNYHEINEQYGIVTGEVNEEPSMTVPDQTMSLKQLIERHARGQVVPQKDVQWDEDIEEFTANWPDLTKLTKIEIIDKFNELSNFITHQKDAIRQFNIQKEQGNTEVFTEKGGPTKQEEETP